MNYRHFFAFITCCTTLLGCGRQTESLHTTTVVDFDGYKEASVSDCPNDFYSNKRFVVLRADDERMMMKNISRIRLHDGKIYASDSYARNFVVHDENGEAIAKIGNRGRGPGEYQNITYFDVDESGKIHLIDGNTDRLLIYGADYEFIEDKSLPFEVDIVKCLPNGEYLFGLSSWDKSRYGGARIIKTDKNLTVLNHAGNYDKNTTDENVWFSDYHFIDTPDGIFYHKSPEENVYLLNDNGDIIKEYFFDLGHDAIPIRDRKNIEPLMNSGEIASYRALMNFAVPYGKYIYGSMYDKNVFKSYLYDADNKTIFTKNNEEMDDFGNILSIDNGTLITFFPYIDNDAFLKDLPENMHAQVSQGNLLICLLKLN